MLDTTFSPAQFKKYMAAYKSSALNKYKNSFVVVPVLIRNMRGGNITIAQNFEFFNDFQDLIPKNLTEKEHQKESFYFKV